MKKAIIIGGLFLAGAASVNAQQLGQFSQYVQNPFILNPGATGYYDFTDINLSMRQQWSGLDDAPQTFYLSVNHRLGKEMSIPSYSPSLRTSTGKAVELKPPVQKGLYHGIGGFLVSDEYGAFKKLTGNLSYAIHLPVGQKYHLSIGAGLMVSNLTFDQNKVTLEDAVDNTYNNFIANGTSSTFFDINAGIWFYSDRLFVGYTSNQLLGDKVSFGTKLGSADLQIHHFATLGYKIPVNDNFNLTPSGMFKLMGPAPASFDLTLKGDFAEKFWVGASYRQDDALVGLIGFNMAKMFKLGYSYDFTTSNLSNYSNGSHEVVLGIMLGK